MAELEAVEVELDARPGEWFALRIDDAAAHPGTGQEREPADVAVLAGEDADIVATLARQAWHVGPDRDRLVGLELGQTEPPVGAGTRGPKLLLVGKRPRPWPRRPDGLAGQPPGR